MEEVVKRYGTDFTESEILPAVTADDIDYAESLIRSMYPGEVRSLQHCVHKVSDLLGMAIQIEEAKNRPCGRWRARKEGPCGQIIGYYVKKPIVYSVCELCAPVLKDLDLQVLPFSEVEV